MKQETPRRFGEYPPGRTVLSIEEVGVLLDRHPQTISRWVDRGIVPSERVNGRTVVIPVAALREVVG